MGRSGIHSLVKQAIKRYRKIIKKHSYKKVVVEKKDNEFLDILNHNPEIEETKKTESEAHFKQAMKAVNLFMEEPNHDHFQAKRSRTMNALPVNNENAQINLALKPLFNSIFS